MRDHTHDRNQSQIPEKVRERVRGERQRPLVVELAQLVIDAERLLNDISRLLRRLTKREA